MPAYILTASLNQYRVNTAGAPTDELDENNIEILTTSFAAADDAEAGAVAARHMAAWLREHGPHEVHDPMLVRHPSRRVVAMNGG